MNDADNTDITSRESEGEAIFYDANQTWQKMGEQLGDFSLNTVVMDLKHLL